MRQKKYIRGCYLLAVLICLFTRGDLLAGSSPLIAGKEGSALRFDGPGDIATFPIGEDVQQAPIRVSFWAKLSRTDDFNILVSSASKASAEHWSLFTSKGDGLLSLYMPQLPSKNYKTGISCADRQWHWISLLIENKSIKLTIDQREALSINLNQSVRLSNAPLILGGNDADRGMGCLGAIDEFQISRPVSTGEKDAILHVYRFDAVSGNVVKDDLQPGIDGRISIRNNTIFLDEVQDAAYSSSGILGDLKVDEEGRRPALDVAAVSILPPEDTGTCERLSLSGAWLMKDCEHFEITADYADYRNQRNKGIAANWHKPDCDRSDWYQVAVPTSVQSALIKLGKLPDPFWNSNTYDEIMQYGEPKELPWPQRLTRIEGSDWWFARKFDVPKDWAGKRLQLYFDGIDYAASVYLNGKSLGYHAGMFGGPARDISGMVDFEGPNWLVVRVNRVPKHWDGILKGSPGWGWHYGHLVSLGIWRDVQIEVQPDFRIIDPFVVTRSINGNKAQLQIEYSIESSTAQPATLEIAGIICGKTFSDQPVGFVNSVSVSPGTSRYRTQITIENPKTWWPLNYGRPDMYELKLAVHSAGQKDGCRTGGITTAFGIRTIEMRPVAGSAPERDYRWQFVINGQPMFIKGANWCWSDPLLECDPLKYERLLELGKRAGIQMLRAWGGGIVETDEFYRQCDAKGILVYQEFPFCWGPHDFPLTDPVVIDQQVSQVVKRLRNHPSLVMWGGGNENGMIPGNDEGLFLTGKRCRQFDPSRPFHRTDPWGGSKHNWDIWHQGAPMDKGYNRKPGVFYGEYGFPSMTGYSSSLKYLPKETLDIWPPDPNNGGVKIHMCMFNTKDLLSTMKYCDYGPIKSWENFAEYSQIAQGDWLMYGAEGQRAGSGENKSGFWFYKLTELFPGYSWGVIDFYGTPKLAYYRAKQTCQPQAAFAFYEKLDWSDDENFRADIHAANDLPKPLPAATISVVVYGSDLQEVWSKKYRVENLAPNQRKLMDQIDVGIPPAQKKPFVLAVRMNSEKGILISDRWYWLNYQAKTPEMKDYGERVSVKKLKNDEFGRAFAAFAEAPEARLLTLPKTTLSLRKTENEATGKGCLYILNQGDKPAINVMIENFPEGWNCFLDDNSFCLKPGEERPVDYELSPGEHFDNPLVRAWNALRTEGK